MTTLLKTIEVEFSKDIYRLDIKEGSVKNIIYTVWINGGQPQTTQRLSKGLKKMFGIPVNKSVREFLKMP